MVRIAHGVTRNLHDAQDAAQNTWLSCLPHLDRIVGNAAPYLNQAAANRARDIVRHRIRLEEHADVPAPNDTSVIHGDLGDTFIDRGAEGVQADMSGYIALRMLLEEGIRGLPPQQRAVATALMAGLSENDIGEVLGIKRGTVKSQTSRVRKKLKQFLEDNNE